MAKVGKLTTLAELRAKLAGQPPPPPKPVVPIDPADIEPDFPYELEYLWHAFQEITDAVPQDDYGAPVVLWSELLAWSELTDTRLRHWELQAIIWIGRTGQTVAAKAYTNRMKQPAQQQQPSNIGGSLSNGRTSA